jgi:hypothetical protein
MDNRVFSPMAVIVIYAYQESYEVLKTSKYATQKMSQ